MGVTDGGPAGGRRLRILMITQVFAPEMGALANRLEPFARGLSEAGHEVFVATGMPNYPRGEVFPEYRGRRTMRERRGGATVIRTINYMTPRNVSRGGQLASYLTFVPASFAGAMRAGPLDVVFVTSPPLFPVISAMAVATARRAKLVLDLRDLWPDEIVAVGAGEEGSPAVRAMRMLERSAYRRADMITCTTREFMRTVEERGARRGKLVYLPNGADLSLFHPRAADNPVAAGYGFGDRFVVMYSGLLGIKHGLEAVVEAADLLRGRPDILFFLRGDGPRRAALEQMVAERGLDNVRFGGEIPLSDVPMVLARADACVTNLLPDPYLRKIISVKVFEYMAMAKPVVAALEGEGARVVREADAGIVVRPGDPRGIADAVVRLADDPGLRHRMGASGRRHVEERYSRQATARRLDQALTQLCGR